MAGVRSTPNGGSTPAGSTTNHENQASPERLRAGQFIKQIERLIAFGFQPRQAGTVKGLCPSTEAFHRDLPKLPPSSAPSGLPSSPYHRDAKRLGGRRPLQAPITTDQAEALQAKRKASAEASDAYAWAKRVSSHVRTLERLARFEPTPSRLRRLQGLRNLQAETLRASNAAQARATAERHYHRLAFNLPAPRTRDANRSRHRTPRGVAKAPPRCPRWWEALPAPKGVSEPPRWRDLPDEALVYMHVAGGYRFGRVLAYTLNLTGEIEAKARTKHDPAAWLRDLIGRHLKAALGRRVEVLVSLEENALGALHAHGIIANVEHTEDGDVRDALKLAGGKGYRGHQLILKASPDSGWASYIAKDYRKSFPFGRFAATRGLRAAAEHVFNELRAMVLDCAKPVEDQSALTIGKSKLSVGRHATLSKNIARPSCISSALGKCSSHRSGGGRRCFKERLRISNGPTYMRSQRSRDGPTRVQSLAPRALIRLVGRSPPSRTGARD